MAKRSRTALERADQMSRLRDRPARAQMLAAARELATARGYEALRAGDIAQAAGVSRETFYTHFADKRSCLAEATAPRMGEIESELRIAIEEQQAWAAPILHALEATLHEHYGSKASPRGRITEALLGLVAERGYASVRLADVIKQAHVSYPSFYRHFASKEECFAEACEGLIVELSERLHEGLAEDADLPARLVALAELLASEPATARMLVIEVEQLPQESGPQLSGVLSELLALNAQSSGQAASALARSGARRTALHARSELFLAGAFGELLRGAVLTARLGQLPADAAALTPHFFRSSDEASRPARGLPRRERALEGRERRGGSRRRTTPRAAAGVSR